MTKAYSNAQRIEKMHNADRACRSLLKRAVAGASVAFGVPRDAIMSASRKQDVSEARFAVYHALLSVGCQQTTIGRCMARDHGTIDHGATRAKALCEIDRKFLKKLTAVTDSLFVQEPEPAR